MVSRRNVIAVILLGSYVATGFCDDTEFQSRLSGLQNRVKRETSLVHSFDLPDVVKQSFLTEHNKYRRVVSPSASNMRELVWDNGLATVAKEHAKNCMFEHSAGFESGENVHRGDTTLPSLAAAATKAWHNEGAFYNYESNTCQSGEVCGHYLQVVWAQNYKFGCGVSLCNDILPKGLDGFLTVCIYKSDVPTNAGQPYLAGPACTACDQGLQCKNDKLCSASVNRMIANASSTGLLTAEVASSSAQIARGNTSGAVQLSMSAVVALLIPAAVLMKSYE